MEEPSTTEAFETFVMRMLHELNARVAVLEEGSLLLPGDKAWRDQWGNETPGRYSTDDGSRDGWDSPGILGGHSDWGPGL